MDQEGTYLGTVNMSLTGSDLRNVEEPEGSQILFRIGINIDDLIVEGDDLYGDGINIASRFEAAVESDCIS